MIPSFPKIWHLGTVQVEHLFEDVVEIPEKIDGSQFVFGKQEGELLMRSKGAQIFATTSDKLFSPVVHWAMSHIDDVPEGFIIYGETLHVPKHNTLKYDRIPANHFAIFGVCDDKGNWLEYEGQKEIASRLGCDVVPLLYLGKRTPLNLEELQEFLNHPSYLGGTNIEGIVVKNWYKICEFKGLYLPVTAAKYVSEQFKEVHSSSWKAENTSRGGLDVLFENYRTEARWRKSVQHLTEAGQLEHSPRDIGILLHAIQQDIT